MIGVESHEAVFTNPALEEHKIAKNSVACVHAPQQIFTETRARFGKPQGHDFFGHSFDLLGQLGHRRLRTRERTGGPTVGANMLDPFFWLRCARRENRPLNVQ